VFLQETWTEDTLLGVWPKNGDVKLFFYDS